MNIEQAQRKAKLYQALSKTPKITYEVLCVDQFTGDYRVVQKYEGNVVWYL